MIRPSLSAVMLVLMPALAFGTGAPAPISPTAAPDLHRVLEQLAALTERVQKLEAANSELSARYQALEAERAPPASANSSSANAAGANAAGANPAGTNAAGANPADRNAARATAPPAYASALGGAAQLASRVTWNGDLRLRHEEIRHDTLGDRSRDRFQAHFGFDADIAERFKVGVQLATGGDDPRSAQQTMTGESSRKGLGVDLAYASWEFAPGSALTAGKMHNPLYRPGTVKFWDSDINPEGFALSYSQPNFFGTVYGFWLEERTNAADTGYVGVQLGTRHDVGPGALIAAVSYSDLGAGAGRTPFFAQNANGNTLAPDGSLAFDFRVLEASLEYQMTLAGLPLMLYADYARNGAADNGLDTAYSTGFLLGKAATAHSWELGYLYQEIEKDSWFGQLVDSDFGGGFTDARGSVLRLGYAPIANAVLGLTYYLNDLALSAPQSPQAADDYQRLQLDFQVKY